MKRFIISFLLMTVASFLAFADPVFDEKAPPSLADHLKMVRAKDPVDGGWLPNLIGLPNEDVVALLTAQINDIWKEERDKQCLAIDPYLRMLVFQHFAIHQHMANAQNIYFEEHVAHKWAHILAMILKESSGDSTSVTDMSGRSVSTFEPKTYLKHWNKITNLKEGVKLNYQTNFGLTQTSTDRLFYAFHLAKNQNFNTDFLEGKSGADTEQKTPLNTAIAIRRLIWFYQDMAQGRITQEDSRIHQRDINKPEFRARYEAGLQKALFYCGTRFLFKDPSHQGYFRDAMASIAYCKLGNPHAGYGKNEFDEKCFAQWVTLCPALNVDIAILTPLSYFATRGAKPICQDSFMRLLNKKPNQ